MQDAQERRLAGTIPPSHPLTCSLHGYPSLHLYYIRLTTSVQATQELSITGHGRTLYCETPNAQ